MWFANVQANQAVIITMHRFHSRQLFPLIRGVAVLLSAGREFNHVMAAQPRNQFRGSTGGDNLSVVNDGEAIATNVRPLPYSVDAVA